MAPFPDKAGNAGFAQCEEGKANRVSLQPLTAQGVAVREKIESDSYQGCTAKRQWAQLNTDTVLKEILSLQTPVEP